MTPLNPIVLTITLGALGSAASAGGISQLCPAADLDGSGAIDGSDLGAMLLAWGPCAPNELPCFAADLNGDAAVDGADLGDLLLAWGPVPQFDSGPSYKDEEAWQIGLEMLGPAGALTLAQELYDRVDQDLDAIRAFEPDLVGETHTLAWVPNQLIVSVSSSMPHDGYDCLNSYYQVTDIDPLFGTIYVLTFASNINVEALAAEYSALPEVIFAEPNGLIGGQNFWTPTPGPNGVWQWEIDDGFTDCFDGCDCHNLYVFRTNAAGAVQLVSFEQFGQPWCDF